MTAKYKSSGKGPHFRITIKTVGGSEVGLLAFWPSRYDGLYTGVLDYKAQTAGDVDDLCRALRRALLSDLERRGGNKAPKDVFVNGRPGKYVGQAKLQGGWTEDAAGEDADPEEANWPMSSDDFQ